MTPEDGQNMLLVKLLLFKVVFLTVVNLLYLSVYVLCWFLAYGNFTFCDKYCGLV
jgi:hypothetical protein